MDILSQIFKLLGTLLKKEQSKQNVPSNKEPVKVEKKQDTPVLKDLDYKGIPLPTQNKSMASAVNTLRTVENYTRVKASYMALIISVESSFDTNAKAPTSSARGWFQFIDRTWNTMLERHADKYNIAKDSLEELRFDARISALMGAELIKENVNALEPFLKREPTLAEIYFAHFLGIGVAKRFLLLGDNVVVAEVLPKEAAANKWVFYNGDKPRTVTEVKSYISKRIRNNLDQVNKYFY